MTNDKKVEEATKAKESIPIFWVGAIVVFFVLVEFYHEASRVSMPMTEYGRNFLKLFMVLLIIIILYAPLACYIEIPSLEKKYITPEVAKTLPL